MKWYSGNISEAVATSKTKNAIFVVYVEGNDDQSKNLTSLINDLNVSKKLETENFVALKLEAGSLPHTQFAEIYKNVPVPSLFFIGNIGQPLDIITSVPDSKTLLDRIENVMVNHTGNTTPSSSSHNLIAGEQAASQTSLDSSFSKKSTKEKPENVVCENGVCKKISNSDEPKNLTDVNQMSNVKNDNVNNDQIEIGESSSNTDSQSSKDEKIELAKKLVEKKREEKKMSEQETERQKEIERRKLGQDLQKLKEWQKDQELKDLMEKRKKEKIENKQARDRILQQIAQDKADRAARFGTASSISTNNENKSDTNPKPETSPRPASQPNSARLQFKLPDGSSSSNSFENYTLLSEVRNYIVENLNLPFRNFKLATSFPRREFTQDDNMATLLELGLCPNSVILIIPLQGSVSLSRQPGGPLGIVWVLLTPIFSLFNIMRNLVFGNPNTTSNASSTSRNDNKRNGDNLETPRDTVPKRRVTESTTVRRQGNIHRFTDRADSDDDQNTWNGNSTQQM